MGSSPIIGGVRMKKKILMIASKAKAHINFRGDLTKEIINKGYEVTLIVPHDLYKEELENMGIKVVVMPYNKNSTSIKDNLNTIDKIGEIIKEEQPDLIFAYTIKPIILGSIAAKKCKINNMYSMVTGLGHIYSDNSLKTRIIRLICGMGYRYAFKLNKKVIFQNQDDINEVVRRHYVKRNKCELVDGSGVNMKRFKRSPLPSEHIFLMVSRVLKEKGVIGKAVDLLEFDEKFSGVVSSLLGKTILVDNNYLPPYQFEAILESGNSNENAKETSLENNSLIAEQNAEGAVSQILIKDRVVGKWVIDSDYSAEYNNISMYDLYGSAFGDYGSGMEFGENGEFSYYIGAGVGGRGTADYCGDEIYAEITEYESGNSVNLCIWAVESEDDMRLAIEEQGLSDTYTIFWKKL